MNWVVIFRPLADAEVRDAVADFDALCRGWVSGCLPGSARCWCGWKRTITCTGSCGET